MIKITNKTTPHYKEFQNIPIGQFFASNNFIFYKISNDEWKNAIVITYYYETGKTSSYRATQDQIFNKTDLVLPIDAEFTIIK